MLPEILKQINWVDILVIILLIRICYIALKNGFIVECFKLLGTLSAVYLSLHYYTNFSDFVKSRVGLEHMPLELLDFLSFVLLAILGYLLWMILRQVICRFIKMQAQSNLNKWGGLILGAARGFLLTGLIIFILFTSTITYLKNSVNNSYSGKRLFKIAPNTYTALWNNLMSKFMRKEKFNNTVLEVQGGFIQK